MKKEFWCACTVEEVSNDCVIVSLTAGMRSGLVAYMIHVTEITMERCQVAKESEEPFSRQR